MEIQSLIYPVAAEHQADLIELWRTEWSRTDFNWLESMYGDYSNDLTIVSMLGRDRNKPVATATAIHCAVSPELALLGSVVTDPHCRGRGLGGEVVEATVKYAAMVGCTDCYLGTSRRPRNVYMQHGFAWYRGAIMHRRLAGEARLENRYFEAGQPTQIREANWGDLPGFTMLSAQPVDITTLDYPRGLVSPKYAEPKRCVSAFPAVFEDVAAHGGTMNVLCEPKRRRVFGFATLTPGPSPARNHVAQIDAVTHDHYSDHLHMLVDHVLAQIHKLPMVKVVQAHVAANDAMKAACFAAAGFDRIATLPSQLSLGGQPVDVYLLQCRTDS